MGSAVSVTSSLGDISSEAIEDFCNEITGQDYTDVFVKHSVDGKVLEKYVGNVDTLLEFLNDIGMTDLDHQQMLYDAMMQVRYVNVEIRCFICNISTTAGVS